MMDVEFLAYILLGALLIITLQILYRSVDPNLPPGSMGWPVIGETLQFLSAGWRGRPERFVLDRMKRFSPNTVFKTCILGEPMAVFCSPQGFKFLFSNENKLVVPWWPSAVNKIFPSAQNSGPAGSVKEAKKMRRLLPNFLKPDALKGYVEIMDKTAKMHFEDCWENKEEVLVFSLAKKYTFVIASRLFLSLDDPGCITGLTHQFHLLTSGIISFPLDFPGTPFNRAVKAARFIRKELSVTIKKRRVELAEGKASPTQDIMSYMLTTPIPSTPTSISTEQHQISNNNNNVDVPVPSPQFMTDLDIADKIMGLLIGGHDTTTVVTTFIVKYLAELPDIYDQVYKEQMEIARFKLPGELLKWDDLQKMKYSWNVACEVLRLHPPLQGAFREAIHSFTYEGFHIPKGWKVYVSMQSTHRNPKYFPDPETFDPTRFEGSGPAPYAFLPFGGGPRMCPGQEYARLVILVFMHNLVTRFKWENLVQDEKIVVNPTPEPTKGLPVRLYPHSHNKRQCYS